jgi:hypothetical protein
MEDEHKTAIIVCVTLLLVITGTFVSCNYRQNRTELTPIVETCVKHHSAQKVIVQ